MARRNLNRREKEIAKKTYPNYNINNWMKDKEYRDYFIMKHKFTGTTRKVPIVS